MAGNLADGVDGMTLIAGGVEGVTWMSGVSGMIWMAGVTCIAGVIWMAGVSGMMVVGSGLAGANICKPAHELHLFLKIIWKMSFKIQNV